jgi:hypothetical protein
MKNLAKLNGVKALSKNEQKSINGGVIDLCTYCGWVVPGFMTCFIGSTGTSYLVKCDER